MSRIPNPEIVIENLKRRLAEKGLSYRDISDISGISPGSLSAWMTGKYPPSLYKICQIARALKCSVEELFVPAASKTAETIEGKTIEEWRARALVAEMRLKELRNKAGTSL